MSLDDLVGSVCILGFGRSGTSLTTSVLGMLGLDLGPQDTMLPAAADDNPRATGLPDHPQRVVGLPDVAVAEHRDVQQRDEFGDRLPVGRPAVEVGGGPADFYRLAM